MKWNVFNRVAHKIINYDIRLYYMLLEYIHNSPNWLNIVFSDELFESATAFSPGGRRSSVGSPLNTPIRPFVWSSNLSEAPTVMSSCSALTPIVSEKPTTNAHETRKDDIISYRISSPNYLLTVRSND